MTSVTDEAGFEGKGAHPTTDEGGLAELKRAARNTDQMRVARRIEEALEEAPLAAASGPEPRIDAPAAGPTLGGRTERLLSSPTPVVRVTGELPVAWPSRIPKPAEEPVAPAAGRAAAPDLPPPPAVRHRADDTDEAEAQPVSSGTPLRGILVAAIVVAAIIVAYLVGTSQAEKVDSPSASATQPVETRPVTATSVAPPPAPAPPEPSAPPAVSVALPPSAPAVATTTPKPTTSSRPKSPPPPAPKTSTPAPPPPQPPPTSHTDGLPPRPFER